MVVKDHLVQDPLLRSIFSVFSENSPKMGEYGVSNAP